MYLPSSHWYPNCPIAICIWNLILVNLRTRCRKRPFRKTNGERKLLGNILGFVDIYFTIYALASILVRRLGMRA